MALIRFAEGQQRSGAIGGSVYSHNAAGQYIRSRSIPVNPNTERQAAVRGYFSALVHAWTNELTLAQRLAWGAFGDNVPVPNRLGEMIKLGGNNWFFACNVPRLQAGLARVDAGPTIFAGADSPTVFTVTGTADDQQLSVAFANTDDWATEVGGALLIYQGSAQNVSRGFYKGPWRYVGKVAGAVTPPTSPATFTAPYAIVAAANTRMYCRAVRADGRISSESQDSFLGAAT